MSKLIQDIISHLTLISQVTGGLTMISLPLAFIFPLAYSMATVL